MTGVSVFALLAVLVLLAVFAWQAGRKLSHLRRESDRTHQAFSQELDRKAVDAEEGHRRLAATLGSMAEGVLVVAPDDRVLLVNAAFVRAFGISKNQVEGRFYWEALREAEVNRLLGEALKTRRPRHEELAVNLAEAVFEIQISPVFNGDDYLGVVAVFHDVSRIKEVERRGREFAANVSHELKTPLTSILGYLETLKEGAIDDAENRMRFLSVIEEHSMKLHQLIEDLLLLSRMESTATPLAKQEIPLRRVAEKAVQMVSRPAAEKKLRISLDVPDACSAPVEASSLERVMINLLENAVKYNVPGGSIRITGEASVQEARLRVADTGIGIAESDLPRIFERFYRSEPSRSRESGGSGLGLSIAQSVIERHGGRIEADSRPGKGSTFTVILPR